jgi:hypothetical protein
MIEAGLTNVLTVCDWGKKKEFCPVNTKYYEEERAAHSRIGAVSRGTDM